VGLKPHAPSDEKAGSCLRRIGYLRFVFDYARETVRRLIARVAEVDEEAGAGGARLA
jgi:hypothetical protein